MIRAVLAVALAAALLGVSLPAVADARAERTAAGLDAAALRVDRAAAGLAASDAAVAPDGAGARRVLRVRLPDRSLASARAAFVAVCPAARPGDPGRVVYALDGREPVVRRLSVPIDRSAGPLVLRDPGAYRVVLEHVRVGGRTVVRATAGRASGPADGGTGGGSSTGTRPPAPCDSSTLSAPAAPTAGTTARADPGSGPRPAPPTTG